MSETCQKLAFMHPIVVLKSGLKNNWMKKLDRVNRPLQSYWNFSFSYIQACIFSRLKLLFNFYVKRTVRRQDFGAKFNLTYHNGTPVADILKDLEALVYCNNNNNSAIILFSRGSFPEHKGKHERVKQEDKNLCGGECNYQLGEYVA